MTDQPNNSQEYWYIPAPKAKFLNPKFHFAQQVGLVWQDEFGNLGYDIAEITGMQYITDEDEPGQWYYRLRFLKCDCNPGLVGRDNEYLEPESRLVADDTAIAN